MHIQNARPVMWTNQGNTVKTPPQQFVTSLAAAKARGVVLGATGPANLKTCNDQRQQKAREFRNRLRPVFDNMTVQGLSRRAMVKRLNELGIKTPMGGTWSLGQVQRISLINVLELHS